MSEILVTGGAGFIGSHVAESYLAAGHQVTVFDNLSTGSPQNLPPEIRLVTGDITDAAAVKQLFADHQFEAVNHHAAHIQVGYSVQNPQFDAQNNVIGLLNICEAAKATGVKRLIMASTGGAMYGNQDLPFVETMREQPLSPYGISKKAGELYLMYYAELYGLTSIILRYSNVYGPRQNAHGESGVIAIFAESLAKGEIPTINGDGTHTRDYVYVSDVCQANLLALEHANSDFFNIGTGVEISTNQVFEKVVQEFGHQQPATHGPDRPGEQTRSSLNSQKAQQVLGWSPKVDFESGVKQTVAWYRQP